MVVAMYWAQLSKPVMVPSGTTVVIGNFRRGIPTAIGR